MAAVNASLMAMNGASLLQRRPAERSTTSRQLRPEESWKSKASSQSKESWQAASTPPETVRTNFKDVFAFSGPAPETINGRLAMLGFVSAVGVEIASGRDLISQLASGGVPLFIGSSLLFTLASVIPMFKGVSKESKSQEIMSSEAEMLNGRFAMLGLVALALTEYLKGGPLIS
eukprot:PITA_26321